MEEEKDNKAELKEIECQEKDDKAKLKENKCKDISFKILLSLLTIATLSPSIAFLVLSILSYDNECKIYFILAFIFQGLLLLSWIIISILMNSCFNSEDDDDDYEDHHHHHPLFSSSFVLIMFAALFIGCFYVGMGIATLVYFIKFYSKLKLLAKIGYFVHFINYLISIIFSLF